jgi:cephalosporin hydroxylase
MDVRTRLSQLRNNNFLSRFIAFNRGLRWAQRDRNVHETAHRLTENSNPLQDFFNSRRQGRGIWKWEHYFEIYERHFAAFRNRPAKIVEVGVLGGGSLEMWREYFGPQAKIYGIDIDPSCKAYQSHGIEIFIGNQGDREFWRNFRKIVPDVDIVIDDGSHNSRHQIITLQEMLPCVNPGGVYLCEDVHGEKNAFAAYVQGLTSGLNKFDSATYSDNPERRLVCNAGTIQQYINSISFYPFVIAIEKSIKPVSKLVAPMHGTEWRPS